MKAYELYQSVDPALVQEMFTYFRETERDVYKSSLASLAGSRKLRPVFVQKKPVPDQIAWMHKTLQLKSSDTIGEHLLQVWFMKGHQPMLVEFCDTMGIEHNGEGSVEGDLPDELDGKKLKAAADTLLGKYHPGLVALYLHVFNLQRPGGWSALGELLDSDERVRLREEEKAPKEEEAPKEETAPAEEQAAPEKDTPPTREEASAAEEE